MGLEELTFYVEGVMVVLKPELHLYHQDALHNPTTGKVPVMVRYEKEGQEIQKEGFLIYDLGKTNFVDPLTDFVPTDDAELRKKYARAMRNMSAVYTILELALVHPSQEQPIKERHYFKDSQGTWKMIKREWLGDYADEELREMADETE